MHHFPNMKCSDTLAVLLTTRIVSCFCQCTCFEAPLMVFQRSSKLLSYAHDAGGDIECFAGDALLVVYKSDDMARLQVLSCQCLRYFANFGSVASTFGIVGI